MNSLTSHQVMDIFGYKSVGGFRKFVEAEKVPFYQHKSRKWIFPADALNAWIQCRVIKPKYRRNRSEGIPSFDRSEDPLKSLKLLSAEDVCQKWGLANRSKLHALARKTDLHYVRLTARKFMFRADDLQKWIEKRSVGAVPCLNMERTLSAKELAHILNLGTASAAIRLARKGGIPYIFLSPRCLRFERRQIERWLEMHRWEHSLHGFCPPYSSHSGYRPIHEPADWETPMLKTKDVMRMFGYTSAASFGVFVMGKQVPHVRLAARHIRFEHASLQKWIDEQRSNKGLRSRIRNSKVLARLAEMGI